MEEYELRIRRCREHGPQRYRRPDFTSRGDMFLEAAFNGAIGGWDVATITSMLAMFMGATNFGRDLNG